MAKTKKFHVLYRQRKKVLTYARDLARSGEHADHLTIIPQLAALEDFEAVRSVFADCVLCAQLDRLCANCRVSRGYLTSLGGGHPAGARLGGFALGAPAAE